MNGKYDLLKLARNAMLSHGLEPEFTKEALAQLETIVKPAFNAGVRDLTQLLWCSIDNDDSRDLDQLSVAEKKEDGKLKIYVAVADVDSLVKKNTPLDQHAQKNTTSVYTGVKIFPMLPEKLSTNLSSLNENEMREAVVIEMLMSSEGTCLESNVSLARVKNKAKLAYNSVAKWLNNEGPLPAPAAKVPGMDEQLRLQDGMAQKMRKLRFQNGALELQTLEAEVVVKDGMVVDLKADPKNRAKELIEDFMVAANGATARFLTSRQFPVIRRVVKSPERWPRIVAVAKEFGEVLPDTPDSKALATFLDRRRVADPLHFPDLSLTVIKLLGRGEYVFESAQSGAMGHFALAVLDYSHSTAPNRRYPDLLLHRLLKSAFLKETLPYSEDELKALATHCTMQEDAASKVERQVRKSAAALLLSSQIGKIYDALITGSSDKGVWARVLQPPVEGRIVQGFHGVDVGDKVKVKLLSVNVERGFIDFAKV